MTEQYTTNRLGKLVQHWPLVYNREEPQTCVGSDYGEAEMWSDLTKITLGDGGVLVINLYSRDERHRVIRECLEKHGDVDLSRVTGFSLIPVTRKIRVQAREAYKGGYEDPKTGKLVMCDIPAR